MTDRQLEEMRSLSAAQYDLQESHNEIHPGRICGACPITNMRQRQLRRDLDRFGRHSFWLDPGFVWSVFVACGLCVGAIEIGALIFH